VAYLKPSLFERCIVPGHALLCLTGKYLNAYDGLRPADVDRGSSAEAPDAERDPVASATSREPSIQ
jgi:hypothetical protein